MVQVVSQRDEFLKDKAFWRDNVKKILANQPMLAEVYGDNVLASRELIFLQSQSNFIEKTLGQGEQIKIRLECLVAHAPTVKMVRTPRNDFDLNHRGQLNLLSSKNKFTTLQGPGIVYIDMQAGSRFFKEIQMSLFTVMLYCMLYILMLAVVTFDKVEAVRQMEQQNHNEGLAEAVRVPLLIRLANGFHRLPELFVNI